MITATSEKNACVADGRKLRSSNSRQKIVDALLQLVRAGVVDPSAEEVAKMANVGLRTVFRRFNEMELLHRELALEVEKTYIEEMSIPLKPAHWKDQVHELLDRFSAQYEHLMPYRVAAIYYKHHSNFISEHLQKWDQVTRQLLKNTLPNSVKKDLTLTNSLNLTLSFNSWIHLRMDQNLTQEQAINTNKRMFNVLLNQCED